MINPSIFRYSQGVPGEYDLAGHPQQADDANSQDIESVSARLNRVFSGNPPYGKAVAVYPSFDVVVSDMKIGSTDLLVKIKQGQVLPRLDAKPSLRKHILQDKNKLDAHMFMKLNHLDQGVSVSNILLFTLASKLGELVEELRPNQQLPVNERQVTQVLVDATPIRVLNQVKEKLRRRGVEAVLSGTEWLKAKEVGERVAPDAGNKHSQVSRWHKTGKIFGIERTGVKYYPNYIFDTLGNPIPEVEEVLATFKGFTAFRVASWFESTSSTLNGKRPREVLNTDPKSVVEAAKAHVEGALHG